MRTPSVGGVRKRGVERGSRLGALCLLLAVCGGRPAVGEDEPAWRPTQGELVTRGHKPWLSPGGAWLAFERTERDTRTRDLKGQPVISSVLYLREVASGAERRAEQDAGPTGWVGDDTLIFGDGSTLTVGHGAAGPDLTTSPKGLYTPGWTRSRDGKQVAYTVRGFTLEDHSADPPAGREHTIHVAEAGQPPRALDLGEDVDVRAPAGMLSFSPDGRRLLFHLGFMQMGALPHPRAGVVDLETNETRFVLIETHDARGQEDSTWERGVAAWGAWDAAGTAAADGSDLRRLTVDGAWKGGPCLSPEGDRCAYWIDVPEVAPLESTGSGWSGREHGSGLRVLQLRTGESVDLPLPPGGRGSELQWAPDGRHLWFGLRGGEGYGVYRIAAPPAALAPEGTPPIDLQPKDVQLSPLELALEDLRSSDRHTVERGVARAFELDDPRATAALIQTLTRMVRGDGHVRPWEMLEVLRERAAVTCVPVLLEGLSRRWAVQPVTMLLLRWDVFEAVPLWRGLVGAGDEDRASALVALARYGGEPGWARLRAEMNAGKPDFRDSVVRTLAAVRDERSVDLLIPLTGDTTFRYSSERDYVLGDFAAGSLTALTGERFGRDPEAWKQWWERVGRVLPAPGAGGGR